MAQDAQGLAGTLEEETQAATEAVDAVRRSAPEALGTLMPLLYRELKRIAHRQLAGEAVGHTLSTTAVVHEAYMRLAEQRRVGYADRGQFFALAARTMRRVLIDHARQRQTARRGGPRREVIALEVLERRDAGATSVPERAEALVALDDALEGLSRMDARLARVVECRFFAGFTETETAEALGVSQRTVARDWQMARAWLHEALRDETA